MLVAAFEVHVSLAFVLAVQLAATHEDGARGGPGIDPHVEGVVGFRRAIRTFPVLWFDAVPEFGARLFEPDVRSMLLDQVGNVANDRSVENRFAFGVVERRDGNAPRALA